MNPTKQQLARARVLVVGDAMLDRYWHGAVERISPEAPVPVVKVTREEERIGAAANVAYNVSTLGAQASFLGVVGDDEPGHRLEALLKDTGIQAHLQRAPSLVAAARWIAGEKLEHEQFHPDIQRALDLAVKPLTRYRCAACGFEAKQHFWQCPGCQAWDSYPARRVEEL